MRVNIMEMDWVYWDHSYNITLIMNLAVVIGLFTSIRLFSGTIAHVNASDELFKKDNPAFGISMAGVTFALTYMLTGAMYGSHDGSVLGSTIVIGVYGVAGIILMALTRWIFDKITLPDIYLRDEISKGNIAVAIADAGNVLAAAIIIRSLMIWVTDNSLEGLLALAVGYVVSQAILTGATYIRRKLFCYFHSGKSIQQELQNGNIALSLSFAGRKIGTAMAISIAANLLSYELYALTSLLIPWIAACLVLIVVLKILSFIAERVILFGINTTQEVLEEKNIAVGALRAVIYISMALMLAKL